jgi:hypothetical protein
VKARSMLRVKARSMLRVKANTILLTVMLRMQLGRMCLLLPVINLPMLQQAPLPPPPPPLPPHRPCLPPRRCPRSVDDLHGLL